MGSRTRSKDCDMILGGFNYGSDSDKDSQSADDGSDSETWSEFGDRLRALDLPSEEGQEQDVKLDVISIDGDFNSQNELGVDVGRSKGQKIDSNLITISYLNIDLKLISTLVIKERLEDIQNINSRFWQPIVYLSKLSIMDTTTFTSSKNGAGDNNLITKKKRRKRGKGRALGDSFRNKDRKLRRANETPEERNKRLTRARERRKEETEEKRNSRLAREREYTANRRRLEKLQKVNGKCSRQFVLNSSKTDAVEYRLSPREKARLDTARRRANETEEQRNKRLSRAREYNMTRRMENETEEQRNRRLALARDRAAKKCREKWAIKFKNESYSSEESKVDVSCDLCQKLFISPLTLNRHNKYYHPEIYKNPAYICELCGRSFKLQIQLDDHKLFIHNPESIRKVAQKIGQTTTGTVTPTAYLCETCGKGFVSLEGYTNHIERHSKILAMRKEAHEKMVRFENPSKSDEEIQEILSKFWNSEESCELITKPESKQESKALGRLKMIEKITKKGLQQPGETMEQCLDRLYTERFEKKIKDRETETEEEKATRRERYRINHNLWIARNKEKYDNYMKSYYSDPERKKSEYLDKNSEKYKKMLAYQRARWAKKTPEQKARRLEKANAYYRARWAMKTPEQKARRLESMRNYAKNRKRK